jgi:hypothetical protein
VNPRDEFPLPALDAGVRRMPPGARHRAWQALAMLSAAALAWLVFSAYRQPDFLLDLAAGLGLC